MPESRAAAVNIRQLHPHLAPRAVGLLVLVLTLLARPAGAAEQDLPLQLEFGTRTVTVAGATPGGKVILLSVHRQRFPSNYTHRSTWRFTADVGADGRAVVTTTGDIDQERIWIVVDQASTRKSIKRSSSDAPIDRVPPGHVKHLEEGDRSRVSLPMSMANVVIIRASEGAWYGRVTDGGSLDADGTYDGTILLGSDTLADIYGTSKKHGKFKKNDLVVAIDSMSMAVVEERLQ